MKHLNTLKGLLLTLLLVCSGIVYAHDFEVNGVYYNILSETDKTVEVTFKGNSYSEYSNEYTGSVTIPQTIRYYGVTYKVTRIGEDAFLACRNLTSISIPNSVISVGDGAFGSTAWYDNQPIGAVYVGKVLYEYKATISVDTNIVLEEGTLGIADHAFYECKSLTAITLSASLINIGESAFFGCKGLKSIEIPNSVTSIGDYAFYGCSSLGGALTIPENVTIIEDGVFCGCSSLTTVTIPDGVTSIGIDSFSSCGALVNVTIPNSVKYIYNNAFRNCSSLTSITIPDGISSISYETFCGCSSLTSIRIPNNITQIGRAAFSGCSGLTSLTIGKNVNNIGMDAFGGCNKLQTVISLATAAPKLDGGNFSSIYASPELYYPYGSDYSSWTIFRTKKECLENAGVLYSILNNTNSTVQVIGADNIGKVTIAENIVIGEHSYLVTKIASNAFTDGVVSVEVPKTITVIESQSIRLCNTLDRIDIDKENPKYDSRDNCIAFIETATNTLVAGCKNSKIPNSVTCVGNKAFYGCLGLTTIDIPNSVSEIGAGAFEGCSSLTSVNIPSSVNKLYCCTFEGCTGLKNLIIEDSNEPLESVLKCNYHASHFNDYFFEDSPIEYMYIGRDLKNYTFSYSYGQWRKTLNTAVFGENVTTIPNSIFDSCFELSSVKIPNSVTSIGYSAFRDCDVTSIVIPNSVTSIGESAFRDCTRLISIVIPNSVTSIGDYAFQNCSNLNDIKFNNNPSLGEYAIPLTATSHLILDDNSATDFNITNANTYADVSYSRTIAEGKYGTIILPFAPDVASLENYAFYELKESGDGYLNFEEVAAPVANTPYIYTLREGKENVAITAGKTTISSTVETPVVDGWETVGSFANGAIDATDGNYYALSSSAAEIDRVADVLTVQPYRAYFKSDNVAVSALSVYINGVTGIKEILSSEIEGFENGDIFDLNGRKVVDTVKGNIYIKDGKKVMF